MTLTAAYAGRQLISACLLSTLAVALPCTHAQETSSEAKPAESKSSTGAEPLEYKTFNLVNTSQEAVNNVQTDLRNILPRAHIYAVNSLGAISIRASAEDLELAQRVISDIDRPAKAYRLTFTINESDAGKPAGSRHITVVAVTGDKSLVKLGSKIPIVTGSFDDQTSKANTQVQYEDIGLDIDAWLDNSGDGLRLRTKIVQSSVADEKSNVGIQDPVLRQAVLDSSANLVEGSPLVLATLDIPGSTHSEQIEAVAEPVK